MSEIAATKDDYVEVTAGLLGFNLSPGSKAAVQANIETIFKLAAMIDSFELPDDLEPAPVFEA